MYRIFSTFAKSSILPRKMKLHDKNNVLRGDFKLLALKAKF